MPAPVRGEWWLCDANDLLPFGLGANLRFNSTKGATSSATAGSATIAADPGGTGFNCLAVDTGATLYDLTMPIGWYEEGAVNNAVSTFSRFYFNVACYVPSTCWGAGDASTLRRDLIVLSTLGTQRHWRFGITKAGRINVVDSAGATLLSGSATTQVPLDAWFRIQGFVRVSGADGGSNNGLVAFRTATGTNVIWDDAPSWTVVDTSVGTLTNTNLVGRLKFFGAKNSATGSTNTHYFAHAKWGVPMLATGLDDAVHSDTNLATYCDAMLVPDPFAMCGVRDVAQWIPGVGRGYVSVALAVPPGSFPADTSYRRVVRFGANGSGPNIFPEAVGDEGDNSNANQSTLSYGNNAFVDGSFGGGGEFYGLSADTQYSVRFEADFDGNILGFDTADVQSRWFNFKTPRATSAAPTVWRFGGLGCTYPQDDAGPNISAQNLAKHHVSYPLDFVLNIGDYGYGDTKGERFPWVDTASYYAAARECEADEGYAALKRCCPIFYLPDDHDGGANNIVLGDLVRIDPEVPLDTMVTLYGSNFNFDNSGTGGNVGNAITGDEFRDLVFDSWEPWYHYGYIGKPSALEPRSGCYRLLQHGKTRLIFMDGMSFKTTSGSVYLGTTQKNWLKSALTGGDETICILVSGGPITDFMDRSSNWRRWGGAPNAEWTEVWEHVRDNRPARRGYFICCADSHIPCANKRMSTLLSGLPEIYEVCVSPTQSDSFSSGSYDSSMVTDAATAAANSVVYCYKLDAGNTKVDPITGDTVSIGHDTMLRTYTVVTVDEVNGTVSAQVYDGITGNALVDAATSGPLGNLGASSSMGAASGTWRHRNGTRLLRSR